VTAVIAALAFVSAPTYSGSIAHLINDKCTPCHYNGGPGPFPLTSYQNVRKHARQIGDVTRSRYMPPWLPAEQSPAFADDLRLTDAQIETISAWIDAGMPEGDQSEPAATSKSPSGWRLGAPDLILRAQKALKVPAGGSDVFWNFILSPQLTRGRYVRAVDIRPTNPTIVHHANIIIDRTGSLRMRESSPGAGFPGMDVTVLRNPLDLDGHFLFWKPGSIPWSEPDGLSWRLDPGNDLILNVHLQPSGKVEWEQPAVALYFTDKPPTRFPYLLQLEHDGALDIPSGARDFVVSDSLRLPVDTEVLAIYPHAHYLGTLLEAWADLPGGQHVSLIRIPAWDPNFQAVYRYRDPVRLPAGTVVHMRYHYDNSRANELNPNDPPKRVRGGNLATDEMAHLWLEILPEHGGDQRRLYAETWARHQLEKYPGSYDADVTLGALALSRLHAPEAVAPLSEAVRLRPEDPIAHNLYGATLEATGRTSEAIAQFRLAVRRQPDYANAEFNLAHALERAGDKPGAIAVIRQILARTPGDATAKQYLELLASNQAAQ